MVSIAPAISAIPLIDVGPLATDPGDPATADALVAACHEVGFCYLSGHRVAPAVEAAAVAVAREFFRLDSAEKQQLAIENSPRFRGYTGFGGELTRGRRDRREQIDLGPEEPAAVARPGDPPWRRLRGPNQWPPSLPQMATAIGAWTDAMEDLALDVLRALAVGLGQPLDYFDAYMAPHGDFHLKIIRYPGERRETGEPAASSESATRVAGRGMSREDDPAFPATRQGVGWHQDSGLLTFILQDEVPGLEVRAGHAVIAAAPRPGTYLLNLGEMLQRATGGYLRATEHRVVSPPPGQSRLSLAYFANPRLEAVFEPVELPPALAAAATGGDNDDPSNPVHRCFGDNYLKIRLRSHPGVAEKFYTSSTFPSA